MKCKILTYITTLTLLVLLAVPLWLAAKDTKEQATTNYQVINLGTLGGSASAANSINNREWVAGVSRTTGDAAEHATLWREGSSGEDLGTLGGPSSGVYWPVKADSGLIVGISETAEEDPYAEHWSCGAFFAERSDRKCVGFVWQKGVMTELPTLGGNNGYAAGANNKGQIVGWAENTFEDPTCNPTTDQIFQFRAVLWEPKKNLVQELPPFGDDSTSAATAINDYGQVVGISGDCDRAEGRFSGKHAVIWKNGVPNDIGNLGGEAWHTPTAINNKGEVTGFSNVSGGGALSAHTFFWSGIEGEPIEDLGAVGDDVISLPFGMNSFGHIVGLSIGASGVRAFLYKDGVMMDLNELVPPGSIYLVYANDINDAGEISGGAVDGAGEGRAYLAIPDPAAIASYSPQRDRKRTGKIHLPESVRRMIRQRLGFDPFEASKTLIH